MSDWQRIELERTGGLAGVPVRVQVGPDDADADRWTELLAAVDLARLDAAGPAGGGPDRFSYALTIEAGGQVHDLHCGERGLPQAVRPLVRALVSRARSVGPTSE